MREAGVSFRVTNSGHSAKPLGTQGLKRSNTDRIKFHLRPRTPVLIQNHGTPYRHTGSSPLQTFDQDFEGAVGLTGRDVPEDVSLWRQGGVYQRIVQAINTPAVQCRAILDRLSKFRRDFDTWRHGDLAPAFLPSIESAFYVLTR